MQLCQATCNQRARAASAGDTRACMFVVLVLLFVVLLIVPA